MVVAEAKRLQKKNVLGAHWMTMTTPPKTNIDTQHVGLEKVTPWRYGHFWASMLNFWGVLISEAKLFCEPTFTFGARCCWTNSHGWRSSSTLYVPFGMDNDQPLLRKRPGNIIPETPTNTFVPFSFICYCWVYFLCLSPRPPLNSHKQLSLQLFATLKKNTRIINLLPRGGGKFAPCTGRTHLPPRWCKWAPGILVAVRETDGGKLEKMGFLPRGNYRNSFGEASCKNTSWRGCELWSNMNIYYHAEGQIYK